MRDQVNDVRPFIGLSFDPSRTGPIGPCLAQPYDVIGPEEQAACLRLQHSIVHLTLGAQRPGDNEADNVYTRAAGTLASWTADGVLAPTPAEAVWVYEQRYAADGQPRVTRGVLARVRLRDFTERRILPHEKVMARPVEDRGRLTLATQTQLEPIWCFYREPGLDVGALGKGAAAVDWHDPARDVGHRAWCVTDPAVCADVCARIGAGPIYIADGHHRYQTMLNIRDEMRRRHPDAGPDAPWEFILIYLVNAAVETLCILPYHRLVSQLPKGRPVLETLRRFTVERVVDWRHALTLAGRHGFAFALALAGDEARYVVSRRGGSDGALDVEVLNDAVLRDALGLTEEDLKQGRGIDYAHDAEAALGLVASGKAAMALLMNPTRLEQIEKVAAAGGVMPRKSSFFYPKPLSGIVLYPMRGDGKKR
jgi:uncharacterized protein (DUF1015 family)